MKVLPPFRTLLTVGALLGASLSTGQAAMMVWEDGFSGSPLDFLHEKWGSYDSSYDRNYSNTWDITTDGYNPLVNSIDGIQVWFAFADDRPGNFDGAETGDGGDAPEHVDISLGGTRIWDDLEVDGAHPYSNYAFYTMVLDPTLHASIFSDLSSDGRLGFNVELQELLSDSGDSSKYQEDTYIKVANIRAWQDEPNQHKVPDGGTTLVLLGASLAGMAGLRRLLS